MHNVDLILTLTGGLAAALGLGYGTQRLGLSPIVGYLLAGIAVGPHTPGFVADLELAKQMAEIGVILLLFGVGLHFHLEELVAVRRIAVPGAVVQSAVATGLGAVVGYLFGWGWTAGVVFGLALSVASTVVLTRVLVDNRDLHTPTGHIAVGWLVVEDVFTVLVLVVLPALFGAVAGGAAGVFCSGAVGGVSGCGAGAVGDGVAGGGPSGASGSGGAGSRTMFSGWNGFCSGSSTGTTRYCRFPDAAATSAPYLNPQK
jgi:CPA2 family monovalent cation:H+ antiporter-2